MSPPSVGAGVGVGAPAPPFGIAVGPTRIGFHCGGVITDCVAEIAPLSSSGTTTAVILRTTLVRIAPVGILVERLIGNRRVLVGGCRSG